MKKRKAPTGEIKLSPEAKAAFDYIESNLGAYCRKHGHSFPYIAAVMVCEYCSLVVEMPSGWKKNEVKKM